MNQEADGRHGSSVVVLHSQLLVAEVLAAGLTHEEGFGCIRASDAPSLLTEPLDDVDAVVTDQAHVDQVLDQRGTLSQHAVTVVLGDEASLDTVDDCLRSFRGGACAWVAPQAPPEQLAEAVRAALSGRLWVSPCSCPALLERMLERERTGARLEDLTARELEVLKHLVAGHDTARTAELMFVSENTVRSHRSRLFHKLGVHSSLEATAVARRAGVSVTPR